MIPNILEFILHISENLRDIANSFGNWSYFILFLIIFAETGLVITPFLPGDSLLFAAGALSASGVFDPVRLFIALACAAVIGDSVNYAVGKRLGTGVFKEGSRVFKPEYLERTHKFYEKYGGRTIILARFIPLVRTFAPFVAGAGQMNYGKFLKYNIIGGLLWITIFVLGGFYFGNLPAVKSNFTAVIGAIIIISILPALWEFIKHSRKK